MSILFCTPCYGGMVTAPHFKSCMNLKEELTQQGIRNEWLIQWNESAVHRARNTLAKTFLETDYEYMMFLDADIEFTPADVAQLWNVALGEEAGIAVGVYPMKKMGAPYAAWTKDGFVDDITPFREPMKVDYAGTGFMLIKRSVFEDLKSPEIQYETTKGETAWQFFDFPLIDGIELSEDYSFCRKAREKGYEIWMDPTIRLIHHGTYGYKGK